MTNENALTIPVNQAECAIALATQDGGGLFDCH